MRSSARSGEFGRIAVNVDTVYRTLDPEHRAADVVEQFRRMAVLERLLISAASGDCRR